MSELSDIPCWYVLLAAVFAVFHAVRGAIGQRYLGMEKIAQKIPRLWQQIVVVYIHDALVHVLCTILGFASLLVAFRIGKTGLLEMPISASLLFVFLLLFGLAGVTGQLAVLLVSGKLPWPKG